MKSSINDPSNIGFTSIHHDFPHYDGILVLVRVVVIMLMLLSHICVYTLYIYVYIYARYIPTTLNIIEYPTGGVVETADIKCAR